MRDGAKATEVEKIFAGGGEMGQLMRSLDWSQTLLGSVENWPQSLLTAASICLNSRFPMVIWWGKELVLLYNDAWRPILGAKHPQALGKPGREIWAEIWDIIGVQLNSVLETGQATWSDDFFLPVERYGYTEEAYFTYSYSPIFVETGKIGGAFTAVNETTQKVVGERRLRTLRELAAHTAEAKTVLQACKLATESLANNNVDIPFALLYLAQETGQKASLVGTSGIESGTPASPEQVDLTLDPNGWELAQVKTTGQAQLITDLATRFGQLPSGAWNESPHTALIMPLTQAGSSELVGWLVLAVSPRRAFDEEYRGFFELVAGNVETAIANARAYEEERKRAEALAELDQAKTVFFSNVSHELRTPLTLMLSPLEEVLTVADDIPLGTQRRSLEMVHRNNLRLLKLVNTLLDFSRIEAGRISAVYEPTDLAVFTSELASVFRSAIEQAGIRLQVDCPPLPEFVYVDQEMWEKIVLNLLSNAFKFTFEGEITVSLRWKGDRVELAIQDTGIGIPTKELPHLFERFHRVKGAQGRSFEGTGIGLSLVQELIKLHGGTVEVTSILGQGSCFTVFIPAGRAHLPPDRISTSRTSTSTAIRAESFVEEALRWLPEEGARDWGLGTREEERETNVTPSPPHPLTPSPHPSYGRILLVDDNADMREYVKRLLSQYYEVETVGDGIAALSAVHQHLPDLVLTDVMMPRLDGFGLLRELRADPKTREIPIVLLSARAGEESRVEGLEAGADDYLIKPFSARELLARVEANLKMARLRQEMVRREQERRLEVEAVKESLETILSSISEVFVTLDRDWRYTYVNAQAIKQLGMQPKYLLGKSIWEVFPDIVGTVFYTELHRAVAEQKPVQFEYYYSTWDCWFENRVYPSAKGVSIFTTNITERKRSEIALQESEERLRSALTAADMGTWRVDLRTDRDTRDASLNRILGLAPQESTQPVDDFVLRVHPEDRELVTQAIEQSLQDGGVYDVEIKIIRPDGTIRWLRDRGGVIRDRNGEPLYLTGAAIDITERKWIQQELERTLQTLSTLVKASPLPIIVIEPRSTIVQLWNPAAEQLFGWPALEVINQPIPIIPEEKQEESRQYQEIIAKGQSFFGAETYRRTQDNSNVMVSISAAPLYDKSNNVNGILLIFQDITEQKRAEEAIHQAHNALEERAIQLEQANTNLQNLLEELQSAEEELRQQNEELEIARVVAEIEGRRYQDLFNFAPDGYVVTDVNGMIQEANRAIAVMFGIEQHLTIGIPLAIYISNSDRQVFRDMLARLDRQPSLQSDELNLKPPNRNPFPVAVTATAIHDTQEQIIGARWIIRDISERKQAQEALRQSEERFRQMAETIEAVFWMSNAAEQQILYISPAYERIWGRDRQQLYTNFNAFLETIYPEDLERVQKAASRCFVQERYEIEYRIVRPDGSLRWIGDHGFLVRDENGQPSRIVGFAEDITERKQIEVALQQSEAKMRSFVDANIVGILYGDVYGNISEANDELLRIVGYTREDLYAGRLRWIDITPPEYLPLDEKRIAEAQSRGACTPYEKEYIRKDGSRIPILVGYSLFGEEKAESVAFILDLSERKQAELQLTEQTQELLNLNETLSETSALLQQRNQELAQFAHIVSHDLKAPLRAIATLSEWIEEDLTGKLSDETQRQMKLLRSRVHRMDALINGLLNYARIGRTAMNIEPVDTNDLLKEVLDSIAPPFTFDIAIAPNLPRLTTKRILLSQVFSNLISNAVKHHDRRDGKIQITATDLGNTYEFTVSDDGPGIAPEHHTRIFTIFQTLKSRDEAENTGVGLAIVKKIVEAEGGSIQLQSEDGQGATFRFTWPKQ